MPDLPAAARSSAPSTASLTSSPSSAPAPSPAGGPRPRADIAKTIPGTGLSPLAWGALIALSTALFLFWGGPLWRAGSQDSHVGRFIGSYLAVVPVAALLLLAARRFGWAHLVAATAATWGVKLVITSALYFAVARGTSYEPAPTPATASASTARPAHAAAGQDYHAATGPDFARGEIRGAVLRGGAPVAGAVVFLDRPLPGLPAAAPVEVTLAIAGARYAEPVYLVHAGDDLQVQSTDAKLHTLHLYDAGRAVLNMPVTASGRRAVAPLDPGIYEARCDTHATERAAVVAVDHPYSLVTGTDGEIALHDVPEGPVTVVVLTGAGDSVRRIRARIEQDHTTTLYIDLSTPEVTEERL